MKILTIILISISAMSCSQGFVANNMGCVKCKLYNNGHIDICDNPDVFATFGKSDKDYVDYINKINVTVFDNTNFTYDLVICKHGKIIDVTPKTYNTIADSVVFSKIIKMSKWNPGKKDDKNVNTRFRVHFSIKPQ